MSKGKSVLINDVLQGNATFFIPPFELPLKSLCAHG